MKKVIEINEKNTEGFCREVVSVTSNYRALLRKPARKINDTIRAYRLLICGDILLLLVFGIRFYRGESSTVLIAVSSLTVLSLILLLAVYPGIMKLYKTLLNDKDWALLTLDDKGVELAKGTSKSVRLGWDHIAFVRAFQTAVCFVDSDASGFIIAVSASYRDEIRGYLTDNRISVLRVDL